MFRRRAFILATLMVACAEPATPPTGAPEDADIGRCRAGIDAKAACGEWEDAVAACEGDADSHTSFPQLSAAGCYVQVHYDGALPRAGKIPPGCGFPSNRRAAIAHLDEEAERFEAIARGDESELPMSLDCGLPAEALRAAAKTNGATLRALSRRFRADDRTYAYGIVGTFGYGHSVMGNSALVAWRPGDACIPLDKREMEHLSVNTLRAARAAAAYHGRVAPVVSFSGSAVHAPLYEAFMQMHLATCMFDVPPDRVLLDPCADHTHTNIRNTGSLVRSVGARTAYLITDDGIQADYLQDFHAFWLIGGEIDQRSLRDWGYILGSWHQASVGLDAGFWYTPYRFWGEPVDDLGSFTCVR
jgi:hypothetical protein